MTTGFRFRAYPEPAVASVLLRWIGCQRFIQNAKVREDRYYRAFQCRFLELAGQHAPVDQAYSHLIGDGGGNAEADTTWLRQVPSQVLRNGAALFYTAYQRFFKGLAKRPALKGRHGEQSVWLTSELFRFEDVVDADGVITGRRLLIGTQKFPCGDLTFVVNKGALGPDGKRTWVNWQVPSSIHVSVNAGRWHVSFSNEPAVDAVPVPSEQDTLDYLRQFNEDELSQRTLGLDRGVVVPLMAASPTGESKGFALLPVQLKRLAQKQAMRARWQRRAARRVKGSKNWHKAHRRAAKAALYGVSVRQDFAHQASRALVNTDNVLFVFEALKVKAMTGSAKGTMEEPGKQVRQKAGLNRSILASAWGDLKLFTTYKARAMGKLSIEVPPHFSSQECSACGHTHADNRVSQDQFVCQRCGHADNADANAGCVLARRGVRAVCSGSYTLKAKKKAGRLRGQPKASTGEVQQNVGSERPESTPVEITVSRLGGNTRTRRSRKQEFLGATLGDTPSTTLGCV